jgi:hypothetical protein
VWQAAQMPAFHSQTMSIGFPSKSGVCEMTVYSAVIAFFDFHVLRNLDSQASRNCVDVLFTL